MEASLNLLSSLLVYGGCRSAFCSRRGSGELTQVLSPSQVARSPLKEFDKEKAWRAVVVQMAQ